FSTVALTAVNQKCDARTPPFAGRRRGIRPANRGPWPVGRIPPGSRRNFLSRRRLTSRDDPATVAGSSRRGRIVRPKNPCMTTGRDALGRARCTINPSIRHALLRDLAVLRLGLLVRGLGLVALLAGADAGLLLLPAPLQSGDAPLR